MTGGPGATAGADETEEEEEDDYEFRDAVVVVPALDALKLEAKVCVIYDLPARSLACSACVATFC